MTWARRLKRVFDIGVPTYGACGSAVWINACAASAAARPKPFIIRFPSGAVVRRCPARDSRSSTPPPARPNVVHLAHSLKARRGGGSADVGVFADLRLAGMHIARSREAPMASAWRLGRSTATGALGAGGERSGNDVRQA